MKTKLVIGILAAIMVFCQGLVFAESADNITATAEDVAFSEDSASGATDDTVMTDELTAPSVDPANNDAEDVKM